VVGFVGECGLVSHSPFAHLSARRASGPPACDLRGVRLRSWRRSPRRRVGGRRRGARTARDPPPRRTRCADGPAGPSPTAGFCSSPAEPEA
jgi:hypothetical protein